MPMLTPGEGTDARPPSQWPIPRLQCALVVGAGGALGSALVGEALAPGRFQRVGAVVAAPVLSATRGFVALPSQSLLGGDAGGAELAFVVLERERRHQGRDDAFLRPDPAALSSLAGLLRRGGVRRLVVVVPHAPALLPQALQRGFAASTELEVARLGFEQVVFLRAASYPDAGAETRGIRRFAAWWLSQLRLMVAPREQPLRVPQLAALVVTVARLLPLAAPGTRVMSADVIWQAAQADGEAVIARWLDLVPPAAGEAA